MPAFSTAALMEWAPNCVADKEERDLEATVSGRAEKDGCQGRGYPWKLPRGVRMLETM